MDCRKGTQVYEHTGERSQDTPAARVGTCLGVSTAFAQASYGRTLMHAVDAVGMTVADMDRSLAFYTQVLSFTLGSDVEVTGSCCGAS